MSYPNYNYGDLLALAAVGLPLKPCKEFWIQSVKFPAAFVIQFGSSLGRSIGSKWRDPRDRCDPCTGHEIVSDCPLKYYQEVEFSDN